MIAEVPYPGCDSHQGYGCTNPPAKSRFDCFLTHARGAIDKKLTPTTCFTGINETVTVIGVGFWDMEHGQSSAAPNDIELHPVLALCFGTDCDPTAG